MAIPKKRKSQQRFEQINLLCDEVLQNLPTISSRIILLIGWRHANPQGFFRKSSNELATAAGVSKRQAQRAIYELVKIGALKIVKRQQGSIPRTYQITGRPRLNKGDTMSPVDNS
jgi:Fic family protein